MTQEIEILFLYKGQFFIGMAYFNDDDDDVSIDSANGASVNLDDIRGIWTLDEDDGVQAITIDNLKIALHPLCDQNGREVCAGDYIARIEDDDKLIVYKVISINETTVNLQVIHDSHCPILNTMRDKITASWSVIPCKKRS